MGMRPDGMERWGVVGICKEAKRLLQRHFGSFMPFFLTFLLPASFLTVFQNVFLATPLHTRFTNAQGADVHTDSQPSLILIYALMLLVSILYTLALAAYLYVVEYVYSDTKSEDDDGSVARKVLKRLPHAFVRVFVTDLWISLVAILVTVAWVIVVLVVSVIYGAVVGSGPTPLLIFSLMLPLILALIAVTIMFALASSIAVLEPEKYGRAALKQSAKYVKGRAATFIYLVLLTGLVQVLVYLPAQAVAQTGLPLWVKISVAILISVLSSVVSAYIAIVGVVTYFVCKSSFDAVLPEFQRGSKVPAAENPYEPLQVFGSTKPETIGEP